jgi:hypothetical protein
MTVNGSWDEALLTSEEFEMILTHLCMSCVCERKPAYYSTRGNMAFSSLNSKGVERVYYIWCLACSWELKMIQIRREEVNREDNKESKEQRMDMCLCTWYK